jgi:hypothetical protein
MLKVRRVVGQEHGRPRHECVRQFRSDQLNWMST